MSIDTERERHSARRADEFVNAYCTANGRILGPSVGAEVREVLTAFIAQLPADTAR